MSFTQFLLIAVQVVAIGAGASQVMSFSSKKLQNNTLEPFLCPKLNIMCVSINKVLYVPLASRINVDRTVLQGTVGGEAHAACTYSAEERFFPLVLVNGKHNLVRSLASQPQYDYTFVQSSDGTKKVLTVTCLNLAERDNGTTFQFEFDNGEDRASALMTLYVYPQQDNGK